MVTSSSTPIQFTNQINTVLNSNNYLLWKSQIVAILHSYNLISFIDRSQEPPLRTVTLPGDIVAPNPDYFKWHKQDQLVLAWILNSLSPSILAQVHTCVTYRQLWLEIYQMHTSQSLARVLELKLKLQTSKKGGATCAQMGSLRYQVLSSIQHHLHS